jgi:hypothetical protein
MQEKICREKFYNFFIFDFIKCYNSKSGKRNQEIIPFASVSRQRKEELDGITGNCEYHGSSGNQAD